MDSLSTFISSYHCEDIYMVISGNYLQFPIKGFLGCAICYIFFRSGLVFCFDSIVLHCNYKLQHFFCEFTELFISVTGKSVSGDLYIGTY